MWLDPDFPWLLVTRCSGIKMISKRPHSSIVRCQHPIDGDVSAWHAQSPHPEGHCNRDCAPVQAKNSRSATHFVRIDCIVENLEWSVYFHKFAGSSWSTWIYRWQPEQWLNWDQLEFFHQKLKSKYSFYHGQSLFHPFTLSCKQLANNGCWE
jgi:hypothetical protein